MDFFIIFGLPSSGKTFVGEVLQRHFGYHFYDGDTKLTEEMKSALGREVEITDSMRDAFFQELIHTVRELRLTHGALALAQTFIKEKYRTSFLHAFPEAQFILVEAPNHVRERRLKKRRTSTLSVSYARKMGQIFETPTIKHMTITNDVDGEENVRVQIGSFLSRQR